MYGEIRSISPYLVRMWENTDQQKLRVWTFFTQCGDKIIKISYDFKELDKESYSQELSLSPLRDLYLTSWFHVLTFTFLSSPNTC